MKILWFVSTLEDTRFLKSFSRFFDGKIDVFHLNFITRLDMLLAKGKHLLPKYTGEATGEVPELSHVFNVLSGRLTVEDSEKAYLATRCSILKYLESEQGNDLLFMIPSGRHVHHLAATEVAKSKGVRCLYINYSNFPGYTFFDPEGTDCQSSIYKKPQLLDMYSDNSIDVDAVFRKFAALKSSQKSIPQKTKTGILSRIKSLGFFTDTLLQKATGIYGDRRINRINNNAKHQKEISLPYSTAPSEKEFLFFPLQVSTDQQVLVNYAGGSIFVALNEALDISKKLKKPLLVREHPAEGQKNLIRKKLKELLDENPGHFFVTTESVSHLIERCSKVITVNSTVGLESRINKKDVLFLGKSFYNLATDRQLAIYLDKYLIDVDYHNPELSCDKCLEIVRRSFEYHFEK